MLSIINKLKQNHVRIDEVHGEALLSAELAAFEAVRAEERLQLVDGSFWTWEFCEPYLLLSRALRASKALQTLYDAAFAASRDQPWDLAITFDEFTPGNMHRPGNRRNQG